MGKFTVILPDDLENEIRERFVRRKGDISKTIEEALRFFLDEHEKRQKE